MLDRFVLPKKAGEAAEKALEHLKSLPFWKVVSSYLAGLVKEQYKRVGENPGHLMMELADRRLTPRSMTFDRDLLKVRVAKALIQTVSEGSPDLVRMSEAEKFIFFLVNGLIDELYEEVKQRGQRQTEQQR